MESKRILEIFVTTQRTFTVRPTGPDIAPPICPQCAAPMVLAEQAAMGCGLSRRTLYQLVERGAVHFLETEAGWLWVCPPSLAALAAPHPHGEVL